MAKSKSKPAKKTTKPAPVLIRRQGDLAVALGVSRQNTNEMLNRQDYPYNKRGPWTAADVQQIREWREAHLREDRSAYLREPVVYPPPQAGPRHGAAVDEPENPYATIMREAARRSIVHPGFYFRAMVGLIESLDRLARPFTHDEVAAEMKRLGIPRGDVRMLDWLEDEQVKARDAATTLTLASQEAVDHFLQAGTFQHLTDDLREDVDEDLAARWEINA